MSLPLAYQKQDWFFFFNGDLVLDHISNLAWTHKGYLLFLSLSLSLLTLEINFLLFVQDTEKKEVQTLKTHIIESLQTFGAHKKINWEIYYKTL